MMQIPLKLTLNLQGGLREWARKNARFFARTLGWALSGEAESRVFKVGHFISRQAHMGHADHVLLR